jgi:hypothetical protein
MPIYEFYCPENNRIYQFYARTLAQGRAAPKCPDNPKFHMQKVLSSFAVGSAGPGDAAGEAPGVPDSAGGQPDEWIEAALGEMEREFSNVDEKDPRAMGRMMRRMAELTGEKIGGEMEEVVRKLEEGADPDSLEEQLGADPAEGDGEAPATGDGGSRSRPRRRRPAPVRDPKLYEYT